MTGRRTTPAAPVGLGTEARRLWMATLHEYQFDSQADLTLLAELCRTVDRLREVQAELRRTGLMVDGSRGQPRPNPLLAVEGALRRDVLAHTRALRLTSLEV